MLASDPTSSLAATDGVWLDGIVVANGSLVGGGGGGGRVGPLVLGQLAGVVFSPAADPAPQPRRWCLEADFSEEGEVDMARSCSAGLPMSSGPHVVPLNPRLIVGQARRQTSRTRGRAHASRCTATGAIIIPAAFIIIVIVARITTIRRTISYSRARSPSRRGRHDLDVVLAP